MKKNYFIAAILISLFSLGGCTPSDVRESLGLSKAAPDEFAVVRRAPLEIPNDVMTNHAALPAPKEGARRPQEKTATQEAKEAILGQSAKTDTTNLSNADQLFLKKTGAHQAKEDIRQTLNQETELLHDRNKPVAERIFGYGGSKYTPSATVVDATKESARIRANKAKGKDLTDGETPSIEE